jgi:hypothetical protein
MAKLEAVLVGRWFAGMLTEIKEISTTMESTEAINSQTLKALIKESLREVLREERLHLCRLLMPFVSDEEQAEIEAQVGSPEDFDAAETVNLTDWVKHGGPIHDSVNLVMGTNIQ